jgi:hypothetical protein
MRYPRLLAVSALLQIVLGTIALAQYEMPQRDLPPDARYLTGGAMIRDFAPRIGYTGGDSAAIAYNAWMPVLGYHQGPVDVQFGYTRYSLKGASCSAVYVSIAGSNDFPLIRGPFSLVLPMILSADYTKSESAGIGRKHFLVGSLGLGTGLKARFTGGGTECTAHIDGAYHYSFEDFDTGSGSSFAVNAEITFLIRTYSVVDGIVLGYRYRHQIWTLGDGRLNYRLATHGPYIGVLL